jgi:putative addiction module CopG family antidote
VPIVKIGLVMVTTAPLPHETARMLKEKVASGDYATESEVIREVLRALQAQEQAVERWLREEVARSVDEVGSSPEVLFLSKTCWHASRLKSGNLAHEEAASCPIAVCRAARSCAIHLHS